MTNNRVIFIKYYEMEMKVLYEITYEELKTTRIIEDNGQVYLEIGREEEPGLVKYPRFKIESRDSAISLGNKISFAKANYDDSFFTLPDYGYDG